MHYLLTYDNGEDYEMNDRKPIAIFDSYARAIKFIKSLGFEEFEGSDEIYCRKTHREIWKQYYDFIDIEKFEMNSPKEI